MIYLHVMNRVDVTVRSPLDRLVARQANNRAADAKVPNPKPRLAAPSSSVDKASDQKGDACIDKAVNRSSSGVTAICDQPVDAVIASGGGEFGLPGADRPVAACCAMGVAFVTILLSRLVARWHRVSKRLRTPGGVSSAACSKMCSTTCSLPTRFTMRIAGRGTKIGETGLTSSSGS